MKKWAFIICWAILAVSCSSILSSKPTGTLSESKMADVLVDIHLTEAELHITNDSLNRLKDTTYLRIRFAGIFRKHDIEPGDFNTSLNYYIEHIEELDKIYVEVINRLTEQEATLLQKPGKINNIDKSKFGKPWTDVNNPWFRTLNKTGEPEEIQYFDSVKYPVSSRKIYYLPDVGYKE